MSVALNKPSTMSSSTVQSIDPPHGLHGLTVLDDETTEWLLNTCPDILAAKQWIKELAQTKEEVHSCAGALGRNLCLSWFAQFGKVLSMAEKV